MGSKCSKDHQEQSKASASGGAPAAVPAPSDNLPKKEVVLKKKLDTALKTGVLNVVDQVMLYAMLSYSCNLKETFVLMCRN